MFQGTMECKGLEFLTCALHFGHPFEIIAHILEDGLYEINLKQTNSTTQKTILVKKPALNYFGKFLAID
jgi:hypothetical protein